MFIDWHIIFNNIPVDIARQREYITGLLNNR